MTTPTLAEVLNAADTQWDDELMPPGTYWSHLESKALAWMRERMPEILHRVYCVGPTKHTRPWNEVDRIHKDADQQDADAILALLTRTVAG